VQRPLPTIANPTDISGDRGRARADTVGGVSLEEDVRYTVGLAWSCLEKIAWVEAGRRPAVVLRSDGAAPIERRTFWREQYARQVLRHCDADVARLRATADGCRREAARRRTVEQPHPRHEACDLGAELAETAAQLVERTGMPADASPTVREAVMHEAQLWTATRTWSARIATWRRRLLIALAVARR
jgi:hypothetical protein